MNWGDRQARIAEWWLRDTLRRTTRPIVLGPWRGEVGFEALYWLPWLQWLLKGVPRERLYVITRGGAGALYPLPADHVLDLYTLRSLKEVRYQAHLSATSTGALKQTRRTRWDDRLVEQACAIWRLKKPPMVIHPSLLYRLCDAYWGARAPLEDILQRTRWDRLQAPAITTSTLPPTYYAVRLYLRATLQAHPTILKAAVALVRSLTAEAPVVVLDQPHHVDDHADLPIPDLPRVFRLPAVPPEQTLAQHAAVIGHAAGFVGTYGGMAQLALRLGVPSLSLYESLQGTFTAHLLLSHAIGVFTGVAFTPVRIADLPFWRASFGGTHAALSASTSGTRGVSAGVVGPAGGGSRPRPADPPAPPDTGGVEPGPDGRG